ncbi:hypothetical protein EOL96_08230 [Candidatus Saccharibacteria bacterium]|nr:hypothetical protein [Candidatus Saccharibacteria bacterium]
MKKYYEYKTLKQAANAFAKQDGWNRATAVKAAETEEPSMGECTRYGYRKRTTGEYVPNAYLANFGWKNTYYQNAVSEVSVPIDWYLWFGWRI